MGMPGWQLGAPRFEDVEVPADDLIGREGDGFKIAMATFDRSRPDGRRAGGRPRRRARSTSRVDYAMRRHAFGKPLIDHQGIQFKLAGMEADVAAARALTYQAATAVDEDDPRLTKLASMAKLIASDAAMRVTTEAVQVLGGNGYLKDFPAERMMRDAKVLQIYEGANEIQRLVIARADGQGGEGARADLARVHARERHRRRRQPVADEQNAGCGTLGVLCGVGAIRRRAHAVGLAVEREADVAAGHLDAARVGHDARLPADDAVALGVDRGERDRPPGTAPA